MLLAAALVTSALAIFYGWQYRQLMLDGTTAPLISVSVERATSGKTLAGNPYTYFASYSFADADGNVHRARRAIDRSLYGELSAGAANTSVRVYFSRAHPAVSTLNRRSPLYVSGFLAVVAAGLWITLAVRMLRA